jgi:hypothetical protein
MAKVEFDPGIESVTGILMGTDPFYIRRYPGKNGVMHIVQARPDRSGHTPSEAEKHTRIVFAEVYGRQKHLAFLERKFKNQLTLFPPELAEGSPPEPET